MLFMFGDFNITSEVCFGVAISPLGWCHPLLTATITLIKNVMFDNYSESTSIYTFKEYHQNLSILGDLPISSAVSLFEVPKKSPLL